MDFVELERMSTEAATPENTVVRIPSARLKACYWLNFGPRTTIG